MLWYLQLLEPNGRFAKHEPQKVRGERQREGLLIDEGQSTHAADGAVPIERRLVDHWHHRASFVGRLADAFAERLCAGGDKVTALRDLEELGRQSERASSALPFWRGRITSHSSRAALDKVPQSPQRRVVKRVDVELDLAVVVFEAGHRLPDDLDDPLHVVRRQLRHPRRDLRTLIKAHVAAVGRKCATPAPATPAAAAAAARTLRPI